MQLYLDILKSHIMVPWIFSLNPDIFSTSVDFVLKDQREKEKDVEEKRPPHREEMDVVPKPWHKDYVAGLEAMSQKLHITTPCMLQVLDFWHTKFG